MFTRIMATAAVLAGLLAGTAGWAADDLENNFRNPPDSAKPRTWWHWMNGNITKEGITADLEAMARVGLGGATMFQINQGTPSGAAETVGPNWRELFAYANREAARLGLELGVQNSAGWSVSGGPWGRSAHCGFEPENIHQRDRGKTRLLSLPRSLPNRRTVHPVRIPNSLSGKPVDGILRWII